MKKCKVINIEKNWFVLIENKTTHRTYKSLPYLKISELDKIKLADSIINALNQYREGTPVTIGKENINNEAKQYFKFLGVKGEKDLRKRSKMFEIVEDNNIYSIRSYIIENNELTITTMEFSPKVNSPTEIVNTLFHHI